MVLTDEKGGHYERGGGAVHIQQRRYHDITHNATESGGHHRDRYPCCSETQENQLIVEMKMIVTMR